MKKVDIDVRHLTRVEGHGNVRVKVAGGILVEAKFDIVESPRFFEVMLAGRPYQDVAWIASRICGICAVAHTTVSLKATEDAFGFTPSARTGLLRRLAFGGEVMQSHALHAFFLVAPDLLGSGSVVPLLETRGDEIKHGLRLKKLANELCAVVAGRHVHPVAMAPGGFTKEPDDAALLGIREKLSAAREDAEGMVSFFSGLSLPSFERETEYVSLKGDGEYPFVDGEVVSSDGYSFDPAQYRDRLPESVSEGSTAKHVRARRDSFMVGALARFNNNHEFLHPKAKEAAEALGLSAPCHNPYMISAAQVVETVHCLEDSITLIDRILKTGPEGNGPKGITPKAGRGVGAVEAPRGTLYHEYRYDEEGRVMTANCVIPTGQNLANMEADMRAAVPFFSGLGDEGLKGRIKMLIRAYDPCISCSTHAIEITIR